MFAFDFLFFCGAHDTSWARSRLFDLLDVAVSLLNESVHHRGALIYTQSYESIGTCPSLHEYPGTTKLANVEINEVIIAVLLSITFIY